MTKTKNRRNLFSNFINFRMQVRYGAYFVTIALACVMLFNFVLTYILIDIISMEHPYRAAAEGDVGALFLDIIRANKPFIFSGILILCLSFLTVAMVFTKNIVGPVFALNRHIDELKKGNYSFKTTLRKHDELKTLMVALNELSDVLAHKKSNKGPTLDEG